MGYIQKERGARLSAVLVAITDGYVIGPECLVWARMTRLEKKRRGKTKGG
jgi:hypothetical protein